jgi:ABC-2 type transport system ATP-binding protein
MIGIRTRDLRKIYNSSPPFGAGGFAPPAARDKKSKQPKPEIVALDGLSLEIAPGEVFGLLGPNGAGKSTTAGILTTRVRPTSGEAWIGKHDVWKEQVAVKRLIGVVAQRPNLDFSLTAREILLFHGAYFGLDAATRTARAETLLDRFKLRDRAQQMVRGFSGGMMQRLSIARSMMLVN